MGHSKPIETTRWHVENAPLPNHGNTYTVVSHSEVIANTFKLLANSGFMVTREIYRASKNASVAQGIYHIYPEQTTDIHVENEKELGMMFAWTNSYDKSKSFVCAIGAYVQVCYNGMLCGDMMNYKRKHRWSATRDIYMHMSDQIKNGEKYYKRLIKDKDSMRNVNLSFREQAELAGRLFIEEQLINTHQLACLKREIEKPSYDYNCSRETAWHFYNNVTHALKQTHPREWLNDQQSFHDFFTVELLGSPASKQMFEKPQEYEDLGDPSQIIVDENSDMIVEVNEETLQMDIDFEEIEI